MQFKVSNGQDSEVAAGRACDGQSATCLAALLGVRVGTSHRSVLFSAVPVRQIFLALTFVRTSGLWAVS